MADWRIECARALVDSDEFLRRNLVAVLVHAALDIVEKRDDLGLDQVPVLLERQEGRVRHGCFARLDA
jgi:hypothetical protein